MMMRLLGGGAGGDRNFFLHVLLNSGYRPFLLFYRGAGTRRVAWAKTLERVRRRYLEDEVDIAPIERGVGFRGDVLTDLTIFIDERDGGYVNIAGAIVKQ